MQNALSSLTEAEKFNSLEFKHEKKQTVTFRAHPHNSASHKNRTRCVYLSLLKQRRTKKQQQQVKNSVFCQSVAEVS